MKLKITNPWIPATLLIGALSAIVIGSTAEEPVATYGVFAIVGFISLLLLVYFPILTIRIFGNSIQDKERVVDNIGAFSISFFLLGIIFKAMHWPGAPIIIIIGVFVFLTSFLPAWYASRFKNSDGFQRVLYFVFCTNMGLLLVTYVFKTQHWPGANAIYIISNYTAFIVLVPLGLYALIFKREKKYFSIKHTFLFGFVIAYMISSILTMKVAINLFNSNTKNQDHVEKNLTLYSAKSRFLYDAIAQNKNEDTLTKATVKKVAELKKISDDLNTKIKEIKKDLVVKADGLDFRISPDSIYFKNILSKSNYDVPTYIMVEANTNQSTDSSKAYILKMELSAYSVKLEELVPEEARLQFKQNNPLDLNDIPLEDGQKEKWETANFNHVPLGAVYTTLTGLQADVRYLEMAALNELFNKLNVANKENIAAQLADLAMKYETQKQEKKIAVLQKDQELNDIKMQAKDAEISNREKTITYFVFALIAFGVLTMFVVRSNILRKQANKVLAEQKDIISLQKTEVESQKHLVEEKQKEIVDSITYAKRLQEAILPAQEIVNKQLPDNFTLYTPKDLVAGDFYWMEIVNTDDREITFIAAADSTGHGVPGAMVSVVCSNALNRAVLEFKLATTGEILDKTRDLVLETFSKSTSDVKDGMDISLLAVIRDSNKEIIEVNWSGANNPLWYTSTTSTGSVTEATNSSSDMQEIKANKQPIGKTDHPKPFTTHIINYIPGTAFYLFTDGYADQFGGPKGKKFKYKQLEDLLVEISAEGMDQQKEILNTRFGQWKQGIEQVDDVCIIGIKL